MFCLIRYTNGDGGYRVRESRLFASEEKAKVSIDIYNMIRNYITYEILLDKILIRKRGKYHTDL